MPSGTLAQRRLYWAEWRNAAKVLRETQGLDKDDLEAERLRLHQVATGAPCRSAEVLDNNKHLDAVLGAFRAISSPGDMNAQLRQLNQQKTRIIWRIDHDLAEMGHDRNYLSGILRRMSHEGKIPNHSHLEDYDFPQLQRIATAVNRTLYSKRRKANAR